MGIIAYKTLSLEPVIESQWKLYSLIIGGILFSQLVIIPFSLLLLQLLRSKKSVFI